MKLKVANGGAELAVSDENFGREYNQALVFQVVNAYLAAGRSPQTASFRHTHPPSAELASELSRLFLSRRPARSRDDTHNRAPELR